MWMRDGSLGGNSVPLEAGSAVGRGKSGVKYLGAGVVGGPTVATGVPGYERALAGRHGGGETVAGAEEWEETLERLCDGGERWEEDTDGEGRNEVKGGRVGCQNGRSG